MPQPGSSGERPLSVGDAVRKDQLLAVVWSKDLGEKKSELIDGLAKLKYDRKFYDEMKALFDKGAKPEQAVRDAALAIQGDLNAVAKAERTLRTWRLSDIEIAAVRKEAERLAGLMSAAAPDKMCATIQPGPASKFEPRSMA